MNNLFWAYGVTNDPNRIAAKILYEHQYEAEFSNLTGEYFNKYWGVSIDSKYDDENPTPTGLIVEHMDLKGGGSTLDIPVITTNTAPPVYGDADMSNQGSRGGVVYTTVGINRMNFAEELIPRLSLQAQILGPAVTAELNRASESLKWRLTRTMDQDLYHTVFYGGSRHTTRLLENQLEVRQFITPHSHANFWTPQGGMVSYSAGNPGTDLYEASVLNALNGVTDTDVFNADVIEELEFQATMRKIPHFETKFGPRRIIIVSEKAMKQLNADDRYRKEKTEAFSTHGWDASAFKNYRAQFSQSLIFSTVRIPGVRLDNNVLGNVLTQGSSFNDVPFYTPAGWYTNLDSLDSSPLNLGILCAPGMIQKAYGAEAVNIESATYPGQVKEQLILRATMAYASSDLTDRDGLQPGNTPGTAAFYSNQSSMVFATGSK
jgi:hypothetical protein